MTLSGLDIIARGDDFEDRAASYEFRAWQWELLHALDGKSELRDTAMTSGVDLDTALDLIHEAQSAGLVHVVSMTLDEYRRSIGMTSPAPRAAAIAEPASDTATHGDHLSTTDTLGSYENTVPAWMIEHHEHSDENAHVAVLHEDVVPASTTVAAEHQDDAVAEHHDDAVAEHHDEAVAEHHDEAVAEHHDEAVAEHHDEAAAEHHDEAVAVDDGTPWYLRAAAATPAIEEPVAETRQDEAVAEEHPATPAVDATPWYMRAGATPEPEPEPESEAEPEPVAEAPVVAAHDVTTSDRVAEPVASTNGHSAAPAWETMSLVTSVDDSAQTHTHDAVSSNEVPDGVSIHLSSHSKPHEYPDEVADTEPEKGSISFSFSPEDAPSPDVTAHASHDGGAVTVAAPAATSAVHVAHDPVVRADAEPEAAVGDYEPAPDAPQLTAPMMSATQAQSTPVVAPAPPGTSATADIVGNLISRAFTFRIK